MISNQRTSRKVVFFRCFLSFVLLSSGPFLSGCSAFFLSEDARLLRSDARRVCTVHGGPCRLPSVIDGFGAGFSCTSYSSLNKDAAKNASAMEKASRNEAEDPRHKFTDHNDS